MATATARKPRLAVAPPPPSMNLRQVVDDMSTDFVQCRDWGHSWEPYTARPAEHGCFASVLRCKRCKNVRTRIIGPRGQVISSGYDYPDGYLVQGMGRLTGTDRDMLRLSSIMRLMEAAPRPRRTKK